MNIVTCEQRSEEWYAARCGIPTSSEFNKVVTRTGNNPESRLDYMYRLAAERITGKPIHIPVTRDMERGIEMEPQARQQFEFNRDVTVKEIGFVLHESSKFGASVDGLIGEDESLEIKCPREHNHVKYFLSKKLPSSYYQQVQGQLLVTGLSAVNFVSYYPGLPLLHVKVKRDEMFIKILEEKLYDFCKALDKVEERLRNQ